MSNIFKLPDPNSWVCKTIRIGPRHELMSIKLSNKNTEYEAKYLEFRYVYFFSGWIVWQGADFRIGTNQELVSVIRHMAPRYEQISEQEMLNTDFEYSKLFTCNTVEGDIVHIIADAGWTVDVENRTLVEVH